jgi:hypothetical protein
VYDRSVAEAGGSGKAEGFADGEQGKTIGKLRLPLPPKPARRFSIVQPRLLRRSDLPSQRV